MAACFPESGLRIGWATIARMLLLWSGLIGAAMAASEAPVVIRYRPPAVSPMTSPPVASSVRTAPDVVDLNRATAADLQAALIGVGPARAAAIVAWREANGRFSRIEDVQAVKGIGPAFLEKNRLRLTVSSSPVQSSPTSDRHRLSEARKPLQKPSGVRLD